MNFDIGPLADKIEMIDVIGVPAKYAILDLRRGLMHRIVVGIVERFEQFDEFLAGTG
jgi:hypothetical protein